MRRRVWIESQLEFVYEIYIIIIIIIMAGMAVFYVAG